MNESTLGESPNKSAAVYWPVNTPNIFLRMAGNGFTEFNSGGGGTVNCQYSDKRDQNDFPIVGPNEAIWIHQLGGNPNEPFVALESKHFPNCFLRLDGRNVTKNNPKGGNVNLQYYKNGAPPPVRKDIWEVFIYRHKAGTRSFALESYAFSGVYLAINGENMHQPEQGGGGSVYATWGISEYSTIEGLSGY